MTGQQTCRTELLNLTHPSVVELNLNRIKVKCPVSRFGSPVEPFISTPVGAEELPDPLQVDKQKQTRQNYRGLDRGGRERRAHMIKRQH